MHKPLSYLAIPILLAASGLGLHAEMRVTTADALKAAVNKTQPVYPMIAKQMKIAGQVNVEVTIATDGSVENVKVISGNAMLTSAVVNAVKKWKFTPFTQNGAPETAIALLDFSFKF